MGPQPKPTLVLQVIDIVAMTYTYFIS